jgi:hypothetical protein
VGKEGEREQQSTDEVARRWLRDAEVRDAA